MIQLEKRENKYFVFSDQDKGKYGPFDAIWIKGVFEGSPFLYDVSSLKPWKHCVGVWNGSTYLLEEVYSKMKYLTK